MQELSANEKRWNEGIAELTFAYSVYVNLSVLCYMLMKDDDSLWVKERKSTTTHSIIGSETEHALKSKISVGKLLPLFNMSESDLNK